MKRRKSAFLPTSINLNDLPPELEGARIVSAHEALRTDAKTVPQMYSLHASSLSPGNVQAGEEGPARRSQGRINRHRVT